MINSCDIITYASRRDAHRPKAARSFASYEKQWVIQSHVTQIKLLFNSCIRVKKYINQAMKLKKTFLICHSVITYIDQYIPIIPSLSFKNLKIYIHLLPFIIIFLLLVYWGQKEFRKILRSHASL